VIIIIIIIMIILAFFVFNPGDLYYLGYKKYNNNNKQIFGSIIRS